MTGFRALGVERYFETNLLLIVVQSQRIRHPSTLLSIFLNLVSCLMHLVESANLLVMCLFSIVWLQRPGRIVL